MLGYNLVWRSSVHAFREPGNLSSNSVQLLQETTHYYMMHVGWQGESLQVFKISGIVIKHSCTINGTSTIAVLRFQGRRNIVENLAFLNKWCWNSQKEKKKWFEKHRSVLINCSKEQWKFHFLNPVSLADLLLLGRPKPMLSTYFELMLPFPVSHFPGFLGQVGVYTFKSSFWR